MTRNRWFGVLVLVLIGALCMTGCRGKKGRLGTGEPGGALGELEGESSLATRPGEMEILSSVKFDNVLFDYDSAQIRDSERSKLETIADYLKKNPKVGVIIEGHCDERGSVEYNMALGERRALAARAYLVSLGIDGSLMQSKSYGEEKPINPGHDEIAWRVNRRAEFVFLKK